MASSNNNNLEVKVGDFVLGAYKCGCVCGRIKSISKKVVVVSKHRPHFDTYTDLNEDLNITKSRIYKVNPENAIYQ